ncbi:MAG TPA: hypothetical protein VGD67_28400 [Pseudonocardiaceae bacterium]
MTTHPTPSTGNVTEEHLAAELAEALYDLALEHCAEDGCTGGSLDYYTEVARHDLLPVIRRADPGIGDVADLPAVTRHITTAALDQHFDLRPVVHRATAGGDA